MNVGGRRSDCALAAALLSIIGCGAPSAASSTAEEPTVRSAPQTAALDPGADSSAHVQQDWRNHPAFDSDGDRIPDIDDCCPHELEQYNGCQDEDGCPDPNDACGFFNPLAKDVPAAAQPPKPVKPPLQSTPAQRSPHPCAKASLEALKEEAVIALQRAECSARPIAKKRAQAHKVLRYLGDGTFVAQSETRCFVARYAPCRKKCGTLPARTKLMRWPIVEVYEHYCSAVPDEKAAAKYRPPAVIKNLRDGTFIAQDEQRGCYRARYRPCHKKCLPPDAPIATPDGDVTLYRLERGMPIYTRDAQGNKVATTVRGTTCGMVGPQHQVVELTLADGRSLRASVGHPDANGRGLETLTVGAPYDGSTVTRIEHKPYARHITRDVLPEGPTGVYWANGVPVGSTLLETSSADVRRVEGLARFSNRPWCGGSPKPAHWNMMEHRLGKVYREGSTEKLRTLRFDKNGRFRTHLRGGGTYRAEIDGYDPVRFRVSQVPVGQTAKVLLRFAAKPCRARSRCGSATQKDFGCEPPK